MLDSRENCLDRKLHFAFPRARLANYFHDSVVEVNELRYETKLFIHCLSILNTFYLSRITVLSISRTHDCFRIVGSIELISS